MEPKMSAGPVLKQGGDEGRVGGAGGRHNMRDPTLTGRGADSKAEQRKKKNEHTPTPGTQDNKSTQLASPGGGKQQGELVESRASRADTEIKTGNADIQQNAGTPGPPNLEFQTNEKQGQQPSPNESQVKANGKDKKTSAHPQTSSQEFQEPKESLKSTALNQDGGHPVRQQPPDPAPDPDQEADQVPNTAPDRDQAPYPPPDPAPAPACKEGRNFLSTVQAHLAQLLNNKFCFLLIMIAVSAGTSLLVLNLEARTGEVQVYRPCPSPDNSALQKLQKELALVRKQVADLESSQLPLKDQVEQCQSDVSSGKEKSEALEENVKNLRGLFHSKDHVSDSVAGSGGSLAVLQLLLVVLNVVTLGLLWRAAYQGLGPGSPRPQWGVQGQAGGQRQAGGERLLGWQRQGGGRGPS